MLNIESLAEFRSHVAGKEEIRESAMDTLSLIGSDGIDHGLISFCYMVAMDETFNDQWSRECRGIVFDGDEVVSRPLHKFFNVNERPETRVENIDWSKVVRIMDKRDGSMIHTVKVGREVLLKSKKSFSSDVAGAALRWMCKPEQCRKTRLLCSDLALNDFTVIFEWTAPDARIVLFYPEPEMRLLHIRDNVSGRYWTLEELKHIAITYDVKLVDEPVFDVPKEDLGKHLIELAKTVEDIEGWVIQFENGDMVKLKTDWYLKRHKAMTFLRERDIAELVLANGIDDLKALLVGEGVDIKEVNDIEARVVGDIRGIERKLLSLATPQDFALPRKDFAVKFQPIAKDYFGMLMTMYSGKTPDYNSFFEKNVLKQTYSLRQLILVPSAAEVE